MSGVVVVDDEDIVRGLLLEILGRFGIDAVGFASAEDALDYLEVNDPLLVVTDLLMPHLSGLDLLRHLHSTRPEIPVVVVTGASTQDTINQATQAGAVGVLCKPFSHTEFLHTVAAVMSDRPSVRSAQLR